MNDFHVESGYLQISLHNNKQLNKPNIKTINEGV